MARPFITISTRDKDDVQDLVRKGVGFEKAIKQALSISPVTFLKKVSKEEVERIKASRPPGTTRTYTRKKPYTRRNTLSTEEKHALVEKIVSTSREELKQEAPKKSIPYLNGSLVSAEVARKMSRRVRHSADTLIPIIAATINKRIKQGKKDAHVVFDADVTMDAIEAVSDVLRREKYYVLIGTTPPSIAVYWSRVSYAGAVDAQKTKDICEDMNNSLPRNDSASDSSLTTILTESQFQSDENSLHGSDSRKNVLSIGLQG